MGWLKGIEPLSSAPQTEVLTVVRKPQSEWQDSNPRLLEPKSSGLPNWPTLRNSMNIFYIITYRLDTISWSALPANQLNNTVYNSTNTSCFTRYIAMYLLIPHPHLFGITIYYIFLTHDTFHIKPLLSGTRLLNIEVCEVVLVFCWTDTTHLAVNSYVLKEWNRTNQ